VLGHANSSTTKSRYAHYAPKKLRAVVLEHSASPAELVADYEAEEPARRASSEPASKPIVSVAGVEG
jgi:hypothetical protein